MTPEIAQRRLVARAFEASLGSPKRLSLMHPRFNLREVAKEMLLLAHHLTHPRKHCPDCIRKHLLTIEAYAEEAADLDHVGVFCDLAFGIAEQARVWSEQFADRQDLRSLAQDVRKVRKRLVPLVFDPRDMATRLASAVLSAGCPHR